MLKPQIGSLSVTTVRSAHSDGIYIGRPMRDRPGSPLANPFKASTKSEAEHNRVVQLYRSWLWEKIMISDSAVCKALQYLLDQYRSGQSIQLVCWCKPLPCHGDVVKSCIEWAAKNDRNFI